MDILFPVGRLVGGHPMNRQAVTDDHDKPKFQADGVTPRTSVYLGVAIAKQGESHWNQTAWGQKIHQEAMAAWPQGQHGNPAFAWKITDGDSAVPNKNNKIPNQREGYPGHWIINFSTELSVKCYHVGQYAPHQQIQDAKAIKPGDYVSVFGTVKGNGAAAGQTPGLYMNPTMVALVRAGQEIVLDSGPSAEEAFGSAAMALPAGALVDTAIAPPAAVAPAMPPVQPAPGFMQPPAAPQMYNVQGAQYTKEQLLGFGWSEAQIAALG